MNILQVRLQLNSVIILCHDDPNPRVNALTAKYSEPEGSDKFLSVFLDADVNRPQNDQKVA